MAVYKRFSPNLRSAFSVVIMIAAWLAFAPTQVGGLASYIIIVGNSMEPRFHIGDLVITHQQLDYQVGDAIVYRNRELKSFVFHRIISQQLGHYTLKGDNNSWVDTYQPSQGEVTGKLWLHIPRGGTVIRNLRNPYIMALIAGALGALLGTSLLRKKTEGNRPMNKKLFQERFTSLMEEVRNRFTAASRAEPQIFNQAEILEGLFFALGVVTLSSLILGMIVFSRPATRTVQDEISYQHLGVFSYSASAPQGVYDTNSIKGGDPIFTKLTCPVEILFQYTLIAAQAENIRGSYQLTAIVSESVSGWRRSVPLQEKASFAGTSFGTRAPLDLCKISSLTQGMEAETGFHPGTYTLVIAPNVRLAGNASDRALESTFNTGLVFRYDHVQFSLVRHEEQANPLVVSQTGIVHATRMEANTMLLLGREISISSLRWIALVGLIAALSGLTLLEVRLYNLSRFDREKFLQVRYGSLMIDVQRAVVSPPGATVDVTSMAALAKLAERFSTVILHESQGCRHTYYAQVGSTTYRFVISAEKTGLLIPEEEALHQEGGA